ncbi:MAG: hypothetical protein H8E57_10120 [Candidatus Cloacimonetes bacterium]|nr:hypothetical protein [Candidatus Cloacimonadota bacterium]
MNNIVKDVSEMLSFRTKFETLKIVIEELYLIALTDSYKRLTHIPEINLLSENKIRNKIQYDFEHNNKHISEYIQNETITFNSESQIVTEENETYRTDIKLYCRWYGRSFVFECKKFNPSNYGYIKGHYDKEKGKFVYNGIERFTELIYAEKDRYAGMIGFVCSGKIDKIIQNLKPKIINFKLVKNSKDLLDRKCVNWKFSFQSIHNRENNTEIHLYHLFFDFT